MSIWCLVTYTVKLPKRGCGLGENSSLPSVSAWVYSLLFPASLYVTVWYCPQVELTCYSAFPCHCMYRIKTRFQFMRKNIARKNELFKRKKQDGSINLQAWFYRAIKSKHCTGNVRWGSTELHWMVKVKGIYALISTFSEICHANTAAYSKVHGKSINHEWLFGDSSNAGTFANN